MSDININLSKWYHAVLAIVPVVAMIITAMLWVDTRYMHKEISDTRFIELQIRIIQSQVRGFHKMESDGQALTPDERIQFDLDKAQLEFLMNERNRVLGIGEQDRE